MTAAMEPVIYEQPVNEHVRVCLRLEQLFNQTLHWMRGTSAWDSRAAISALLEILNVLDRPDLKAKLVI
jgi:cell division protein ZapD